MVFNEFSKQIKNGEIKLGINIMYPVPGVIERIGADWDWVWIDAQHGQFEYNSILACVRACDYIKVPSVIRVPNHDYGFIGLALDTGASGVMVPMVNTAEEAELIVKASKFPPVGQRSYGARRLIDLYGRGYSHTANSDTIIIAQIETKEGLMNVDEIANVQGIDVIFFSPDDMAMQDNMNMDELRKPKHFEKEMKKLAETAKNAGKNSGYCRYFTGLGKNRC